MSYPKPIPAFTERCFEKAIRKAKSAKVRDLDKTAVAKIRNDIK